MSAPGNPLARAVRVAGLALDRLDAAPGVSRADREYLKRAVRALVRLSVTPAPERPSQKRPAHRPAGETFTRALAEAVAHLVWRFGVKPSEAIGAVLRVVDPKLASDRGARDTLGHAYRRYRARPVPFPELAGRARRVAAWLEADHSAEAARFALPKEAAAAGEKK